MKISLICTTYNREKELDRMIESLINSSYKNIQLIILDQNRDSQIYKMYYNKLNNNNIEFDYINTNGRLSLSCARNLGEDLVKGDIVGFADDDSWYNNNFFLELVNEFKNNIDLDVVLTGVYDPISKKVYGGKSSNKDYVNITYKNVFKYSTSVGIFIKKSYYDDVGFDEELGLGSKWFGGEDIDYVMQLLKNRANIKFINSLKVYHEVENEENINYDKLYKYSIAYGAISKKTLTVYKIHYILINYYIRMLKNIIGIIVFLLNDNKRKKYYYMFKGCHLGFKKYNKN